MWNAGEDWSYKELQKCWHILVPYCRGRVLDIGSGPNRTLPNWVTLDSGKDFGGQRVSDLQGGAEVMGQFVSGSWDSVVSSHVLEHIEDWESALAEWWRLVKVGGHLCLYLPSKNYYPNVGQPGANPDHKHDFVNKDILEGMARIAKASGEGFVVLEDETRSAGSEYSFLQVYRKRPTDEITYAPWRRPEKSCMVVRYGANGDQVLAASILPGLKKQGYTITWNGAPPQTDIVARDPHIDAFWFQDKDQVPNERLGEYWAKLSERFDKVVNLCESVEGALLTLPGRITDNYSDEVRRKLCNVNYMERTHDIAGVPHDFAVKFYPSETEAQKARDLGIGAHKGRTLLWALNGSSVHKVWPWMPQAVVRLMYQHPDLKVITCGDERSQALEKCIIDAVAQYFGDASRLVATAGVWPVRGTFALAQQVDVVVGPETGVLNAVCMEEKVQKVIYLSHSSEEMLTKHWKSTAVLKAGDRAPCYPCARLHYDWSRCREVKETGTALCQNVIGIDEMVAAISGALDRAKPPSAPIALVPAKKPSSKPAKRKKPVQIAAE